MTDTIDFYKAADKIEEKIWQCVTCLNCSFTLYESGAITCASCNEIQDTEDRYLVIKKWTRKEDSND